LTKVRPASPISAFRGHQLLHPETRLNRTCGSTCFMRSRTLFRECRRVQPAAAVQSVQEILSFACTNIHNTAQPKLAYFRCVFQILQPLTPNAKVSDSARDETPALGYQDTLAQNMLSSIVGTLVLTVCLAWTTEMRCIMHILISNDWIEMLSAVFQSLPRSCTVAYVQDA